MLLYSQSPIVECTFSGRVKQEGVCAMCMITNNYGISIGLADDLIKALTMRGVTEEMITAVVINEEGIADKAALLLISPGNAHVSKLFPWTPLKDSVNLETRALNVLLRNGVNTIDQLASHTRDDLLEMRGMGVKCIDLIEHQLDTLCGLRLRQ